MKKNANQRKLLDPREVLKATIPRRKEMEEFLKENIIGQDDFIKKITVAFYRKMLFGLNTNVLIVGESGSGKTATIKLMADALGLPYTIESSTEYTEAGYVGADMEDIIDHVIQDAAIKNKLELIGSSIVVMDEIDKKAEVSDHAIGESVSGAAVQQRLLKFMDGMTFQIALGSRKAVLIDTSGMFFVCMGAFQGLSEIRDKRLNKNKMGFIKGAGLTKRGSEIKPDGSYTEADFIEYGMIKEFIGRFDCVAETNKLTQTTIQKIILESKISAFNEYKNFLESRGIEVIFSNKMIKNYATKAFSMNIGARGVRSVANYVFEDIICNIMDNMDTTYTECKLCDNIVYDNKRYILK